MLLRKKGLDSQIFNGQHLMLSLQYGWLTLCLGIVADTHFIDVLIHILQLEILKNLDDDLDFDVYDCFPFGKNFGEDYFIR